MIHMIRCDIFWIIHVYHTRMILIIESNYASTIR